MDEKRKKPTDPDVMPEIRRAWREVKKNMSKSEIDEMLAKAKQEAEDEAARRDEVGSRHNVDLTSFHDARAHLANVALIVS